MTRIVLDVDTGIDDTLAICYLLGSDGADLLGVIGTYGNVLARTAVRNNRDVLRLFGREDIPVLLGCEQPSWADLFEVDEGCARFHGGNGLGNVNPADYGVHAPAGADAIPADKMGLDIGPESQKLFHDKIVDSKTVVWNGPMGVFEVPEFAAGTKAVAQGLVDATAAGAFTIVGGGDSASAVRNFGFPEDGFSHISTGGGASLEFLVGKELPGLKVLE